MENPGVACAGAPPGSPQNEQFFPYMALTHDISASVASILLSPSSRAIHPHLFQAWNFTPSPRAPSPPPSAHFLPSPPSQQHQLPECAHSPQPAQPEQPLDYGCLFSSPPISLAPPALPITPDSSFTSTSTRSGASSTCAYLSSLPSPPCAADLAQSKKDQPLRAEVSCWEAEEYRRLGRGEVLTEVVKQPVQRSISPSRERRKSVLRSDGGGSYTARPYSGTVETSNYNPRTGASVTVSGIRSAPSSADPPASDGGSFFEQLASFFTPQYPGTIAVAAAGTGTTAGEIASGRAPPCAAKPPRPPSRQSLLPPLAPRRGSDLGVSGTFGRKGHERRLGKSRSRSRSGGNIASRSGMAEGGQEGVMLPMLVLLVILFFVLTFVQHMFSVEQSMAADEAQARMRLSGGNREGGSSGWWDGRGNRSGYGDAVAGEDVAFRSFYRSDAGDVSGSERSSNTAGAGVGAAAGASTAAAASRAVQNRKLGRAPVAQKTAGGEKAAGASAGNGGGALTGGTEGVKGTVGLGELGSMETGEGWENASGKGTIGGVGGEVGGPSVKGIAGLAEMAQSWGLASWQMRRRLR